MSGWLDGRVAYITGGGSGIGRAVVDAYVREGAAVCVLERDAAKCRELARSGERVVAVDGDATCAADHTRAIAAGIERFGRLDVAATFVGIFDNYTALQDIPTD